jgi:hypothetical protein
MLFTVLESWHSCAEFTLSFPRLMDAIVNLNNECQFPQIGRKATNVLFLLLLFTQPVLLKEHCKSKAMPKQNARRPVRLSYHKSVGRIRDMYWTWKDHELPERMAQLSIYCWVQSTAQRWNLMTKRRLWFDGRQDFEWYEGGLPYR